MFILNFILLLIQHGVLGRLSKSKMLLLEQHHVEGKMSIINDVPKFTECQDSFNVFLVFPSKSSLLSAILGELSHTAGVVKVRGELTYTSQQPWIFPGTIRSNILFGKPLNPLKYSRVLKACALKRVRAPCVFGAWLHVEPRLTGTGLCLNPGQDVELLPGGDLTVVGDRGANLSGGQKARVSLAR